MNNKDISVKELESFLIDKKVIIVGGFDSLDYEDKEALKEKIKTDLNNLKFNNIPNEMDKEIIVICDANTEGIGCCQKVAQELGIKTIGMVNPKNKNFNVVTDNLDYVIPSSEGDTESTYVLNLLKLANPGEDSLFLYYGGTQQSLKEIEAAIKLEIDVSVNLAFEPKKENIEKAIELDKGFIAEPLNTYSEIVLLVEKQKELPSINLKNFTSKLEARINKAIHEEMDLTKRVKYSIMSLEEYRATLFIDTISNKNAKELLSNRQNYLINGVGATDIVSQVIDFYAKLGLDKKWEKLVNNSIDLSMERYAFEVTDENKKIKNTEKIMGDIFSKLNPNIKVENFVTLEVDAVKSRIEAVNNKYKNNSQNNDKNKLK